MACIYTQVFIICSTNYLTFQSWLLLKGGSFNFYCALIKSWWTKQKQKKIKKNSPYRAIFPLHKYFSL